MKYELVVQGTVTYRATVELTDAQYNDFCIRIDEARGFARDSIANDLLGLAHADLADPTEWGDLEVETLDPVT